MKPLCNANIEVLQQLKKLVELSESIYLKAEDSDHAGIGQHVRHVLDHYRAFKNGVFQNCVDYNLRTRNSTEETNPAAAHEQIDMLIAWLANSDFEQRTINVISEISLVAKTSESMISNPQRELLYLINHSIHHMAYASLLAQARGIKIPRDIGLAPGTATYERDLKQAANVGASNHA